MAPRSSNLAEQLILVSEAYSNINIDYQACYLSALRIADYVIWEDKWPFTTLADQIFMIHEILSPNNVQIIATQQELLV